MSARRNQLDELEEMEGEEMEEMEEDDDSEDELRTSAFHKKPKIADSVVQKVLDEVDESWCELRKMQALIKNSASTLGICSRFDSEDIYSDTKTLKLCHAFTEFKEAALLKCDVLRRSYSDMYRAVCVKRKHFDEIPPPLKEEVVEAREKYTLYVKAFFESGVAPYIPRRAGRDFDGNIFSN
jgi:hypothetical protein